MDLPALYPLFVEVSCSYRSKGLGAGEKLPLLRAGPAKNWHRRASTGYKSALSISILQLRVSIVMGNFLPVPAIASAEQPRDA